MMQSHPEGGDRKTPSAVSEDVGHGTAPMVAPPADKMTRTHGFSVIELLIVMGIVAIVSALATPAFLQWRNDAKMREAVSMLRGDLEMAKIRAIRENAFVVVFFNASGYQVFIDDGAGAGGVAENWIPDGDEAVLQDRGLPDGVSIDLANTTFTNKKTRFNGRGYISNQGIATLVNTSGDTRTIDMNNRFGRITVN